MRHCIDDPSVGVVTDVPLETARAVPFCPLASAEKIIDQLGTRGGAFVRTPYLDTFYYAARKTGHRLSAQQTFRNGVPMHRITRMT